MDPNSFSQNQFEDILANASFDHSLRLFQQQNQPNLQEEQKFLTPIVAKKKGRPKGLKSNKSKSEAKQQEDKPNKNSGHWLKQENKRYHWFLEIHSNHFIHRHLRRMDKIFKTMADFIGTRQAQQCRSHHQKMQKKYLSFYKIIKSLRNQFYLSCDQSHVRSDFQNNGIMQYDPLITQQILQNEKQIVLQQNQVKQSQVHLQPIQKNLTNHIFFLGDNYENGLNYHGL